MGIVDYPRHFLLLDGGALALAATTWLPSLFSGRPFALSGMAGALHATAVVPALRARPSWAAFVGAAVTGVAAPGTGLLPPPRDVLLPVLWWAAFSAPLPALDR
jgi:hypothetical protein